jgi:aspartate racemase
MKNINNVTNAKIGIVSGIGPLAGSDVYYKLLRCAAEIYGAVEDHEYPDVILLNHGIQGVDNTGGLSNQFETDLLAMVTQLEQNGSSIIGIACNTAHTYLDKIHTKAKVVNLLDLVAQEAANTPTKHLLLTSSATREEKLYQGYLEKYDVKYCVVNDDQQKLLDQAIGLVMAFRLKEAGELLVPLLRSAKNMDITSVIAGCTELPIAIGMVEDIQNITVIDSNAVLAYALADAYYESVTQESCS